MPKKSGYLQKGMAKVLTTKSDNSKVYGFLDRKGQFAITPQFDQAYPFSDGMANVRIGKNSGYVDKKGRMEISDSIMKCVSSFFRGYAIVENGNGDYGLIDSKGRLEINPQFSEIYPDGDMLIVATSGDEKTTDGVTETENSSLILSFAMPHFSATTIMPRLR